MKTQSPQAISHRMIVCVLVALVNLALAPADSLAQAAVTEEEYAKRQQGLIEAIAAMEAAEARQKLADQNLEAAKEKNLPLNAEMERAIRDGAGLAEESAPVAKAKSEIVAREARLRRGAPAAVVAALAPPGAPAGGAPSRAMVRHLDPSRSHRLSAIRRGARGRRRKRSRSSRREVRPSIQKPTLSCSNKMWWSTTRSSTSSATS